MIHCNACGSTSDTTITIYDDNIEAEVCPVCKSDNWTYISPLNPTQ